VFDRKTHFWRLRWDRTGFNTQASKSSGYIAENILQYPWQGENKHRLAISAENAVTPEQISYWL
jgi:hypothetical protein